MSFGYNARHSFGLLLKKPYIFLPSIVGIGLYVLLLFTPFRESILQDVAAMNAEQQLWYSPTTSFFLALQYIVGFFIGGWLFYCIRLAVTDRPFSFSPKEVALNGLLTLVFWILVMVGLLVFLFVFIFVMVLLGLLIALAGDTIFFAVILILIIVAIIFAFYFFLYLIFIRFSSVAALSEKNFAEKLIEPFTSLRNGFWSLVLIVLFSVLLVLASLVIYFLVFYLMSPDTFQSMFDGSDLAFFETLYSPLGMATSTLASLPMIVVMHWTMVMAALDYKSRIAPPQTAPVQPATSPSKAPSAPKRRPRSAPRVGRKKQQNLKRKSRSTKS